MAGEAVWSTWSPKSKAFVKSPEMVCRLLTPEEQIALAPDTFLIVCEQLGHCWFEAPGAIGSKRRDASGNHECFKKNGDMKNGRPVYQAYDKDGGPMEYHKWEMRWLYYNAQRKYWTLGIDGTNEEQKELYLRSAPTDCYSPLVAPWIDDRNLSRYRAVVPHELDAEGFPPSKGGVKTKYRKVVPWRKWDCCLASCLGDHVCKINSIDQRIRMILYMIYHFTYEYMSVHISS